MSLRNVAAIMGAMVLMGETITDERPKDIKYSRTVNPNDHPCKLKRKKVGNHFSFYYEKRKR